MADVGKRRVLSLLAIGIALHVAGACDNRVDSESRLLEESCAVEDCVTSGSARRTTALTSDSLAFKLGPGTGKLVIPIPAFSRPGDNSFRLEALVSGSATARLVRTSCAGETGPCTDDVVDTSTVYANDYDWRDVGYFGSGSGTTEFDGFRVEIETSSSQELSLVDLRYDTYDTVVECSVYAPGQPRR